MVWGGKELKIVDKTVLYGQFFVRFQLILEAQIIYELKIFGQNRNILLYQIFLCVSPLDFYFSPSTFSNSLISTSPHSFELFKYS